MVRISLGILASLSLATSVTAKYCGLFTTCEPNCSDKVSQCDFSFQECLNDYVGGCVDIVTVTYTNSICDYSTTTIEQYSTTTAYFSALIILNPSVDFEETAFVTNTVAGSTSTEVVTETEYTTETITPQAQGGVHRLAKRTPTSTVTYDYTISCEFDLYIPVIITETISTTGYSDGDTIYGTTETVYSTVEVTASVEIVTNTQTDTITVQTTLAAAPSSTAEAPSSTTEAPTSTAPAESSSQPADTTTEEAASSVQPSESSAPSNEPISSTLAVGTSTAAGATQASSLAGTTTGTLATSTVPPASSVSSSASVSLFTGGVPRLAGYGGTFWLLLLGWL